MTPDLARVAALVDKERRDLRGSWAPWLPGLFMLPALAVPFLLAVVVPAVANEPLERSDLAAPLETMRILWPELTRLNTRAAVQALLFQQFFLLVVLVPVSGAMSLAAHSIIGEKQARSLEPLLATPLTPVELLLAKVLAALAPALALEGVALILYLGGVAVAAEAGVLGVLLSGRTVMIAVVLGPLAALVALQLVVLSSTRAKDPRSAQQVGVLVVVPIVAALLAQGGGVWLSVRWLVLASGVLLAVWLALLVSSARTFDAERVLTRWR